MLERIKMSDYRDNVLRTANMKSVSFKDKLSLGGLGIGGEAGEVVDLIKKVLHHDKPLDKDKLIKELGDVRWYLEYLAITIDVSMEEIEAANVTKLKARYPNGFSYEAANNRIEDAGIKNERD